MDIIRLGFRDEPNLAAVFSALILVITTFICLRIYRDRIAWGTGLVQWIFLISCAGFISITVSPTESYGTARYCSLEFPIPGSAIFSSSTTRFLNVLIAIPMGVTATLLRRRNRATVATLGIPFIVEFIQWAIPQLGRTCSGMDASDNLFGVILGIATGVALRMIVKLATKGS